LVASQPLLSNKEDRREGFQRQSIGEFNILWNHGRVSKYVCRKNNARLGAEIIYFFPVSLFLIHFCHPLSYVSHASSSLNSFSVSICLSLTNAISIAKRTDLKLERSKIRMIEGINHGANTIPPLASAMPLSVFKKKKKKDYHHQSHVISS
jgi:hypothetical protein